MRCLSLYNVWTCEPVTRPDQSRWTTHLWPSSSLFFIDGWQTQLITRLKKLKLNRDGKNWYEDLYNIPITKSQSFKSADLSIKSLLCVLVLRLYRESRFAGNIGCNTCWLLLITWLKNTSSASLNNESAVEFQLWLDTMMFSESIINCDLHGDSCGSVQLSSSSSVSADWTFNVGKYSCIRTNLR